MLKRIIFVVLVTAALVAAEVLLLPDAPAPVTWPIETQVDRQLDWAIDHSK